MRNISFIILTALTIFIFYSSSVKAQCSDAGICQIGQHSENQEEVFSFSASYKFGVSDDVYDVKFHTLQLNALYNIFDGSSLQLLLPYKVISGPVANVNGIGDLILSWNQEIFANEISMLSASAGVKLATGDDNKEPLLPMVYQPGLGSNDFIFAVDYMYKNFGFGAGYQLAGKRNDNTLVMLKRGDDLLLRAFYNFSFDEFSINPQILFIKRLSKSSVSNLSASPGVHYVEVPESDQAQLNLLAAFKYKMNNNISLIADFAIPFINREVNVDGLTRKFTASVGVRYSFY